MKKTIIFLLFALAVNIVSYAQDAFYYYDGKQIPLTENASKIVVISPLAGNAGISNGNLQFEKSISDSRSIIEVYKVKPSMTAQSVKSLAYASVSNPVSIQSCFVTEDGKELIPTGYIDVKLKSEKDYPALQSTARQYDCEIIGQNPFMPLWYSLRLSETSGRDAVVVANSIYESGKFASSSPGFSFDALEISYDPNVLNQWGLYNSTYEGMDISVSQAWGYSTGRGITIAIVDQGIDLAHQDLADNISSLSYDTETKSSPSKVYGAHGTHCAGIAAAVRNNGIQVAGVAPDATLMSVSNTLSGSTELESNLANGINWAWQHGADIISCSWWCSDKDIVKEAIDLALSRGREGRGCVFVKSAGNTSGPISFPGDYRPEVIAVANMKQDGTLSATFAYGSNMFVTAPGTYILSTVPGNAITYMGGTSMAAPHVAGLAALILERNPQLSAYKVREIIAKNAKKIGTYAYDTNKTFGSWNEHYGYGLIDAYKAVVNTPRR